MSFPSILITLAVVVGFALARRIVYNLYFHPLAKYHGPWYAACFSIVPAVIALFNREPQWLRYIARKYGHDKPIRITTMVIMFPQPAAVKEIYWDPKCNTKGAVYENETLGPTQVFSTIGAKEHKELRKAIGAQHYTLGVIKNNWEPRIGAHVELLLGKLKEASERGDTIMLADKVTEFAADIMTLVSFTEPWGFVRNGRDERNMISKFREAVIMFGFITRWRWIREVVLKTKWLAPLLLPKVTDSDGMGYLMGQADKEISLRRRRIEEENYSPEKPDFLQYCIDARTSKGPLTDIQKRAHVTLLIQAGADTTATALGSTLRFIMTDAAVLGRVRAEIQAADQAGLLTRPVVLYEETRTQLPFFTACIKESLRLHPPAPSLFPRVTPPEGKTICGTHVPGGINVTTHVAVVQRDPILYAPDPDVFRPERWLDAEPGRLAEMEASQFTFGAGPRVCLGKDVAMMELYKLVPELIRRFDFEVKNPGQHIVSGGVAYNKDFEVRLRERQADAEY